MGYNINHGASILAPTLSLKIINADPEEGDIHLFQRMLLWVEHVYHYEDVEVEEDEDEDSNNSSSQGEDDEEEANNSSNESEDEDETKSSSDASGSSLYSSVDTKVVPMGDQEIEVITPTPYLVCTWRE